MKKAIFLDRDGTLIENGGGYPFKNEHYKLLPGVLESLKKINSNYLLFIITNQSGIGRGYYTEDDFFKFNNLLIHELVNNDIHITKTYYCPHSPDESCECRKPSPLNILKAQVEYELDLDKCWMIGDAVTDMETAKRAGMQGILVSENQTNLGFSVVKDFKSAVELINSYD